MSDLFSEMLKVDFTVGRDDTTALETRCVRRNYMFSVKKCVEVSSVNGSSMVEIWSRYDL